jgi:hypothetical protein
MRTSTVTGALAPCAWAFKSDVRTVLQNLVIAKRIEIPCARETGVANGRRLRYLSRVLALNALHRLYLNIT